MTDTRYPEETLGDWDDDGTMPERVATLREAVVGQRIVSAKQERVPAEWGDTETAFVLTLDSGRRVILRDNGDCCAYTELQEFFLHPEAVDHMILGVGTTDGYETWHIFADFGDVLKLKVGWSAGNTGYYTYGFDIQVEEVEAGQ